MKMPPRYVVEEGPISGGFGTTYICNDLHLSRKVVVKQISDKTELKRLIDEIVALQKVKSRHVVQIYDLIIGNGGGQLALVEEFLPNNDLMDFAASGPAVAEYYNALYQIACGVRDIHSCGIVHRDLKPNNMKRDQDGAIKIFDFGLAKIAPLPKSTSALIGTPGFMAPELFYAPPQINFPVDAFAFGATAYFLATGMLYAGAPKGFAPPNALPVGESIANYVAVSSDIAQLIDACLALDPHDRPVFSALARALQRELLVDRHKALVADGAHSLILNKENRSVKASRGKSDSIEIAYDGYDFKVASVSGAVSINNKAAAQGDVLDGSYVIVLGDSGARRFVTFDVSHPEVLA